MHTCTKQYRDIPFAHRQHKHDGHCRFVHGHNWTFEITFAGVRDQRDENGFVVDFGKLGPVKDWINERFDHALILNHDDPLADHLEQMEATTAVLPAIQALYADAFAKVYCLADCSCEGLANYVFGEVDAWTIKHTEGRVKVIRVTVYEDSKNSASFHTEFPLPMKTINEYRESVGLVPLEGMDL